MTVRTLVALLLQQDPDAEVRIAEQPSWPFEYFISSVCNRHDLKSYEENDVDEGDGIFKLRDEQNNNDVLLAAGNQICYGDKNTWEVGERNPIQISNTEWLQLKEVLFG